MARLTRLLVPASAGGAAARLLAAAALLVVVFFAGAVLTGAPLGYGPLMYDPVLDTLIVVSAFVLAPLCLLLALPVGARGAWQWWRTRGVPVGPAGPRRVGRPTAVLATGGLGVALALALALVADVTAGALAGGPFLLTCAGARAHLQPTAATGATGTTLEFTGSRGEWHTPPFTVGEGWTVTWTSNIGELHIRRYDPTHPRRRATGPRGGPADLGALLGHLGHERVAGSAAPPGAGTYCLTISSGFHYEPGMDNARRPQPRWRVTIEGVRAATA